jgi:hypothetical protein
MSTHIQSTDELETHDIYFAAYLLLAGCVLKKERRVGPRKYFVFTNPAGSMGDLRTAFYSGSGTVKAHEYSQKIMAMKSLCMAD